MQDTIKGILFLGLIIAAIIVYLKSNYSILYMKTYGTAFKIFFGATFLIVGALLIIYGFIDINSEKNTMKGMIDSTLANHGIIEKDHTPIIRIIIGAVLDIFGLYILLYKKSKLQSPQQETQLSNGQIISDYENKIIAETANDPTEYSEKDNNISYKYCGKCGFKNVATDLFCVQCGEKASK